MVNWGSMLQPELGRKQGSTFYTTLLWHCSHCAAMTLEDRVMSFVSLQDRKKAQSTKTEMVFHLGLDAAVH